MRARGFTLFEMLAVILLIGIAAAAVSIPVTQGLASARVNVSIKRGGWCPNEIVPKPARKSR